jgi:hypothetical protein
MKQMPEFTNLVFLDGDYRISQGIHRDLIRDSLMNGLPGHRVKKIIEEFAESILQHYKDQLSREGILVK